MRLQLLSNADQGKIMLNLIFPMLLLVSLISSGCATTTNSMQQHSPTARNVAKMEAKEDKEGSLEKLTYEELIYRGNRHLAQGDPKLASLHFQMALRRHADSAEAYAGLGESLALNGDNQSAHAFLDKALLIDNRNRQALLSTGKLYREERNYEQAEISFTRAIQIYPDDPETLTELAITYGRIDKEELAAPLLTKVVKLKPQDASAYNNLGFNYLLRKNYPEAIESFRQALKIEPDSHRIMNNLAAAYALDSQPQKAFNLFRKTGNEATAYNDLGYIYMIMGKDATARSSFDKAIQLNPRYYIRAKENLTLLETEQDQELDQ